jgi:fructose transport system ATP-binding protein
VLLAVYVVAGFFYGLGAWLDKRAAVLNPRRISMSDTVAVRTGALPAGPLPAEGLA